MGENIEKETKGLLNMFGLTYVQTQILFSLEHLLVENDKAKEKNSAKRIIKEKWLEKWSKSIESYFGSLDKDKEFYFFDKNGIIDFLIQDIKINKNHTWINIVALECLTYVAYIPLGDKESDNAYKKMKYKLNEAEKLLFEIFVENCILTKNDLNGLQNTYKKSITKISSVGVLVDALIVIACGAIGALVIVLCAPEVAVALLGTQFAGLKGAALASACLATLGGGAIAVGGTGVAGGTMVLAGGGAMLGLGIGGGAGAVRKIMSESPQFTLTQSAKLETVLKEIILAENNDVIFAQKILEKYREQIKEMNQQLGEYILEEEKYKKELKAIKETLKYMSNANKDMNLVISAFNNNKENLKLGETNF